MKRIISALLSAAMTVAMSTAAFATTTEETHTVLGFSGGARETRVDLRQLDGSVKIPFDLGENADDYQVEIDITQGGRHLDAQFNKSKNALIVHPNVDTQSFEAQEYEMKLEILDRKTRLPVSQPYTLSGSLVYDKIQQVKSGGRYNNTRGVLYEFDGGAQNVQIYAGHDVTLRLENADEGIYNLHLSTEENDALMDRFPDADLSVMRFEARPAFSRGVTVVFELPEELYLYEYAAGVLKELPVLQYDRSEGYVLQTERLGTYVASTAPLTAGPVDVDGYEPQAPARPAVKNNPTTGAPDGV